MQHADPDALSLAAYGEPALTADDVEHVTGCAACRDELHDLRRVVRAARGPSGEPAPVTPPASVWQAVAAATGVTAVPSTPDPLLLAGGSPGEERRVAGPTPDAPAADGPAPGGPASHAPADVLPLTGRRRSALHPGRRVPWAAAAVAAAVAAVGGVAVGGLLDDDSSGGTVVARAALGPLPGGATVSGVADVSERDGSRRVTLDLSGLAGTAGYYEVWLLDADGGLVSLGPLSDPQDGAALPVPDGVDLERFSVVDVSAEPLDGNPAHSADSVARGDLVLRS